MTKTIILQIKLINIYVIVKKILKNKDAIIVLKRKLVTKIFYRHL